VVKVLDRKLLRDLSRMRAQVLAIVLVVAAGVASYVSMLSTHASLERSANEYFESYAMADLFTTVNRAPLRVAEELRALPGVEQVQTRVVREVIIDVPGLAEPGVGRLVSLPADGEPPVLNRLHVREGRWPDPLRAGEVLVNEAFAEANGIGPGDRIRAIIGGARQSLEIVGIALSPEYVYTIPAGSIMPDDRRYAIFWMSEAELAPAFDMDGAFNDLTMALSAGASEAEIADAVDRRLDRYGSLGAYGRDRQTSARYVRDELQQLESFGAVMPIIFLGVAAFLLNVVMSRMVSGQREQIAALKALGYGNVAVGMHYAKLMMLVALLGAALGGGLGAWMGDALIGLYAQFFRFPALEYRLELGLLVFATLLGVGAGLVGTFGAVRRAVKLPPAEAMRPPAPTRFGHGPLERIGVGRLLGPPGRMMLRNLERRPLRTLSSMVGIALSVALLVAGSFTQDALDYVMEVQFELIQRDDLTVGFDQAVSARAVQDLRDVPGVLHAEPSRDVPVRLRHGHRQYETAVQGLPADTHLRQVLDLDLRRVPLPERGVLLTRELGDRLRVGVGDVLDLEVLDERRLDTRIAVAGFVDETMGLQAYMELEALNRLLLEGHRVTGARVLIDPAQRDRVYQKIKEMPRVAGATLRSAAFDIFDETFAQMRLITMAIMVAFASVIAVGVVYNSARVLLADRSRELASMRVIGFTRAEISWILLGELAVQVLVAMPIGWWLGYMMASGIVSTIDAELFRFPLMISPATYAFASAVVIAVGAVTALVVRRKLDHLDLVEVLKTKE
jgi:putative ABC transport system permease protein